MAAAETFTPTVDELVDDVQGLQKPGTTKVRFESPNDVFEVEGYIYRESDNAIVVCLQKVEEKA